MVSLSISKNLRKEENTNNILGKFIYRVRKNILGAKLGVYIPAGVFAEGLHIWHYGNIIVNAESKVGKIVCYMVIIVLEIMEKLRVPQYWR